MNKFRRIEFVENKFSKDFSKIGSVYFHPKKYWPITDGCIVKYGVALPILSNGSWSMDICPEIIAESESFSDEEFELWVTFLLGHIFIHLIVESWGVILYDDPSALSNEERVDEEFEAKLPDTFAFGKAIMELSQDEP